MIGNIYIYIEGRGCICWLCNLIQFYNSDLHDMTTLRGSYIGYTYVHRGHVFSQYVHLQKNITESFICRKVTSLSGPFGRVNCDSIQNLSRREISRVCTHLYFVEFKQTRLSNDAYINNSFTTRHTSQPALRNMQPSDSYTFQICQLQPMYKENIHGHQQRQS